MKLAIIFTWLVISCTNYTHPTNAGTETTNGVASLSGTSNIQEANILVTAKSIVMTPTGDSILLEDSTTTNSKGDFFFENLDEGVWQIETYKSDSIAIQTIQVKENSSTHLELDKSQTLVGRVLLQSPSQTQVLIPGTNIRTKVDTNGFYTLSEAPTGTYDLAFVDGNRINYLTINTPNTDTLYLRDVIMSSKVGKTTSKYNPYNSSTEQSFAIVPNFYSKLNTPNWYANHDFNQAEYFLKTTTENEIYNPQPKQILFVGNKIKDDFLMIERLSSQGYTVSLKLDNEVQESDTLGIDLIYTSYSITSTVVGTTFKESSLPIIINENMYAQKLGLISNAGSESTQNIQILSTSSPITAGLSGGINVTESNATMEYGSVSSDAEIIASQSDNPEKAFIYIYETGDTLINGVASGRRIGFFASSGCAQVMNENGWKLFDNLIESELNLNN